MRGWVVEGRSWLGVWVVAAPPDARCGGSCTSESAAGSFFSANERSYQGWMRRLQGMVNS